MFTNDNIKRWSESRAIYNHFNRPVIDVIVQILSFINHNVLLFSLIT